MYLIALSPRMTTNGAGHTRQKADSTTWKNALHSPFIFSHFCRTSCKNRLRRRGEKREGEREREMGGRLINRQSSLSYLFQCIVSVVRLRHGLSLHREEKRGKLILILSSLTSYSMGYWVCNVFPIFPSILCRHANFCSYWTCLIFVTAIFVSLHFSSYVLGYVNYIPHWK